MQSEQLILVETFCTNHQVEVSFIESLQEYGLVEIVTEEDVAYLPESTIGDAEQLVRLYNDLQLNLNGLEVVKHLLSQLKSKEAQINALYNRLRFYEY